MSDTTYSTGFLDELTEKLHAIELNTPFALNTDGDITTDLPDVDAPSVVHIDAATSPALSGGVAPEILIDGEEGMSTQWSPLTNMSGQYAYHGPIMHPSENVGRAIAAEMLRLIDEADGHVRHHVFTPVEVECDDTCDDQCLGDHEPAGWVILARDMHVAHLIDTAVELYDHQVDVLLLNGAHYIGELTHLDDDTISIKTSETTSVRIFLNHIQTIESIED